MLLAHDTGEVAVLRVGVKRETPEFVFHVMRWFAGKSVQVVCSENRCRGCDHRENAGIHAALIAAFHWDVPVPIAFGLPGFLDFDAETTIRFLHVARILSSRRGQQ